MKQNETFSTFVGDYQLSDKKKHAMFHQLNGLTDSLHSHALKTKYAKHWLGEVSTHF